MQPGVFLDDYVFRELDQCDNHRRRDGRAGCPGARWPVLVVIRLLYLYSIILVGITSCDVYSVLGYSLEMHNVAEVRYGLRVKRYE